MNTKRWSRNAWRAGLLVTLTTTALVLTAGSSVVGAAGSKTCAVRNTTLAKNFGTTTGAGLQKAIDAAAFGNTIEVRGRCVGNFVIGKTVTLVGRASNAFPVTILDGGRTGTVLRVTAGDVALNGFVVTNGSSASGGGIDNQAATVRVSNSTITGNAAGANGGGVSSIGGTVTLTTSTVSGNTAGANGGGAYVALGGTLTIVGSIIGSNHASVDGGGLATGFASVLATDSALTDNTATRNGGGLYAGGGTVTLAGTSVTGNAANPVPGSGGGIYNDPELLITGVVTLTAASAVTGNTPDDCVGCSI